MLFESALLALQAIWANKLRSFLTVHSHYWGARVEVARCFAKMGRTADARRLWNDAVAVEPHLRELLGRRKQ